MRNILRRLFVGCCAAVALMACGDDGQTDYASDGNAIRIVQNDLIFPADGSSATVIVEADGAITAQVDADWCEATVEGRVVTVTAESNSDFSGRTALLTITAGSNRRQLPVQQLGMVLDLPMPVSARYMPNEGGDIVTTIVHNLPLVTTTPQSWIHPVVEGNTLRVTVDSNVGGHIRRGYVACECGGFRDTLRVSQYDIEDDIIGTYYMMGYYGGDPNTPSGVRFDIVQRGDSLFMNWPQEQYSHTYIPVTLDMEDCTLFIPSGFVLRQSSTSVTSGYFYDTEGKVATASGAGATARLAYYASSGYNAAPLVAANWEGHTLGGFIIYLSSAFVSQTLLQLGNPAIMRIGPVGTTLGDASRLMNIGINESNETEDE